MSTDKDSKTRTASEALAEVQAEAPGSSESKKARQEEKEEESPAEKKKAPSDDEDDDSDDAKDEDYEDDSEDEAAVAKDVAEEAAVAAVLQAEQEAKLTNGSRLGDLLKCHPEAKQMVLLMHIRTYLREEDPEPDCWMFSVNELKEVFGITLDQFYCASQKQLAEWMFKNDDDFPTDEGWTEHEEFMAVHSTSADYHIGQDDGDILVATRTVTLNA
jgi:hypothetical protein